jgi:hypothetical protein
VSPSDLDSGKNVLAGREHLVRLTICANGHRASDAQPCPDQAPEAAPGAPRFVNTSDLRCRRQILALAADRAFNTGFLDNLLIMNKLHLRWFGFAAVLCFRPMNVLKMNELADWLGSICYLYATYPEESMSSSLKTNRLQLKIN